MGHTVFRAYNREMPELDELKIFLGAVSYKDPGVFYPRVGMLHCPKCGDSRRMDMILKFRQEAMSHTPPILTTLHCVQCDTSFTGIVYKGPGGLALAVLPSTYGGLTTPHTPAGVAYYLDQAQRAHSIGANSAAITMFRGALEHLLFEQGFKTGMCGRKIADLEKAIVEKTAPKWAYELDTEFLTVMKQLGDGSIHPNDGDVTQQEKLDSDLIARVRHTFQMLLFLIYELPHEKQQRKLALQAGVIKK
jgi:hypothetical protein